MIMRKDFLYPLRRLHGRMHESTVLRRRLRNCRVLIPGTPEHENLGDSAIVLAQIAFLRQQGFSEEEIQEITWSEYPGWSGWIHRYISKSALVAQLGGGNMGSQWKREENFHRRIVQDFPRNPMVIFPQTIHYGADAAEEAEASKAIYGGHEKLVMVAREQASLDIMKALYPTAKQLLTPDIVLFANMDTFGAKSQERNGVLLCLRSDAERAITDETRKEVEKVVQANGEAVCYTDMYGSCQVTKENRAQCVKEKMEELASARVVVTDRLHGMVFAALTGTPCIVFGNYNHKVKGTYEWIRYLPYVCYVETAEEAAELLPQMLKMGGQNFDNTPLMPYFEKLAQVVRGYANN